MRTIHILSAVCIVLLLSACASRGNGSPQCISRSTDVTSEPSQTTSGAKPYVEREPAKILGLTIFPDVREIKVGDTMVFDVRFQMSPGAPPRGPTPPPGVPQGPLWETNLENSRRGRFRYRDTNASAW